MLELVYRHTPIYEVISYTLSGIWKYFFCSECLFFYVYDTPSYSRKLVSLSTPPW
jgi:hypothetical protein